MTRIVKIPNVCICSQWSQQWNLVICGQLNQQCYKLLTGSLVKYLCVMTRTVNPPNLCVMTGTVNLPSVFICGNQQCHNLAPHKWHNHLSCVENWFPTQPELIRNCQVSTIKHWYPSESTNVCPDTGKMQSNHMWSVKAELKKSQFNTRSQLQTSKCKRDTKPQTWSIKYCAFILNGLLYCTQCICKTNGIGEHWTTSAYKQILEGL